MQMKNPEFPPFCQYPEPPTHFPAVYTFAVVQTTDSDLTFLYAHLQISDLSLSLSLSDR